MKLNAIDRLIVTVLLLIPLVIACVAVVIVSIKGAIKMLTIDRMLKVAGPAAFLGIGVLAGTQSRWFLIPFLLLFAFLGWSSHALRCPTCGWCVYLKRLGGPGAVNTNPHPGDYYWSPIMAKGCFQCGADLTQVQFDWRMFRTNWKPSSPYPNFPCPRLPADQ